MKISMYLPIALLISFTTMPILNSANTGFDDVYDYDEEREVIEFAIPQDNPKYTAALARLYKEQNFRWLVEGVIAGMGQPHVDGQTESQEPVKMKQPDQTEKTIADLKTVGIDTIIALNGFTSQALEDAAFTLYSYPLPDPLIFTVATGKDQKLKEPLRLIAEALRTMVTATTHAFSKTARKAVVVHCEQGNSRTGAFLMAWLQLHHKQTAIEIQKTKIAAIGERIRAINKATHSLLFLLLKNNTANILGELLPLRHPEIVNMAIEQYNAASEAKHLATITAVQEEFAKLSLKQPSPSSLSGSRGLEIVTRHRANLMIKTKEPESKDDDDAAKDEIHPAPSATYDETIDEAIFSGNVQEPTISENLQNSAVLSASEKLLSEKVKSRKLCAKQKKAQPKRKGFALWWYNFRHPDAKIAGEE